ncbi:SRPBCC family protein [Thalassomonas viridans]|uniref:SRPBCC family protein n=1 Tax=Thalassomonas viridans TaxID=137584 RepID=A0AAE9Z5D5_9GAMM|nr:SRPBCC family protein [Thalassomonas viridans]WDE05447.1 SRPBCC family protein [Thalassomonas viridans]
MKISRTVTIKKPVNQVWQVAAEDFANAYKWMTGVVHSYENSAPKKTDSPVAGRICNLENKKEDPFHAVENILRFDGNRHILEFEIFPVKKSGPGIPIIKNHVVLSLSANQDGSTQVYWNCNVELKLLGKLLYPLLKLGLNKGFDGVLNDLKVYLETGRVSAKKQKFDEKIGPVVSAGA